MGSASSKFRKHLNNGDELAALQLYNNNGDLRKGLDPNSSYGDSHNHETPLHYAARHGMKSLLRIFLHDHQGNPNKTNGRKETCLHCVCTEKPTHAQYYPVQKKRLDCLNILLKWRGAALQDGEHERVDLSALDENQSTALHYAASSGLKYCVETLVQHGAPLFTENINQETPCDSAEKGGHADIALYLESKMVFSNVGPDDEGEEDAVSYIETEDYSGLRAQDLQEAKDQLLVETADMLCVPLFTAEALLRNHEWSREMLLEAWMADPLSCCEKSGVIPPPSVFCDTPHIEEPLFSSAKPEVTYSALVCDICTQTYTMVQEGIHISCEHQFCKDCWTEYLNLKIQEGDAHHITCPAFQCDILVPVEMIERVVSRDMARRYLQFDIKAFVDSNPSIKWCPYPGCGRAVKLPELEDSGKSHMTKRVTPSDTSRAVDCGNGHYFCWDCSGEAHEPSSCENWTKWYQKVGEVRPEELSGTEEETMSAANCLWLVTNSKPCPNCKSPIQKNEGCNHMKCSKCKHDFCWVCLDQWKRHNSSTGGYFKCNRYEAVKVVQEETQKAQTQAEDKNQKMQELNKFVHYYTRFKNHENSYKLEEPLLSTTKNKMQKLAEAVTDIATANSETQFVEHSVQQLLKARRVLKCSYVYGYYLDGPGYKKIVFEFMQTELEECTEILSQMVNRLYLRTPRKKIIEQAHIVQRKRHEFILAISKGLVPPETPPGLRKHRRRKYSMDFEDEELRKAILASMQEVDITNPWIKDASGRHTNVMAVLDWPDSDDSDADEFYTTQQGRCKRNSCKKPRAKNPRTGEIHEYCSRQCMLDDRLENPEQTELVQEVIMDDQMDLLRALEMSRLQYLQEQGIITRERGSIAASLLESPSADSTPTNPSLPRSQDKSPLSRQKSPGSRQKSPGSRQKSPNTKHKGKGKGKKSIQAAMEELDLEIQRVLEISSISPSELKDPSVPHPLTRINDPSLTLPTDHSLTSPLPTDHSLTSPMDPSPGTSRRWGMFDEPISSCVKSVPNKSVDDTQHEDCISCFTEDDEAFVDSSFSLQPLHLGQSSIQKSTQNNGFGMSKVNNQSESENTKNGADQSQVRLPYVEGGNCTPQTGSCFGVIKDLSVSNLHIVDGDKVKNFPQKNIKLLMEDKTDADFYDFPTLAEGDSDFDSFSFTCHSEDSSSRREVNRRASNQATFHSVLSAIAANTPGEDELDRFVLCSPAESHDEHVISYESQESHEDHGKSYSSQMSHDSNVTSYESQDSPLESSLPNLDVDEKMHGREEKVEKHISATEGGMGVKEMDCFYGMTDQMTDYSADFLQSLLQDRTSRLQLSNQSEQMDQSDQSTQATDQSKCSSQTKENFSPLPTVNLSEIEDLTIENLEQEAESQEQNEHLQVMNLPVYSPVKTDTDTMATGEENSDADVLNQNLPQGIQDSAEPLSLDNSTTKSDRNEHTLSQNSNTIETAPPSGQEEMFDMEDNSFFV